MVIAARLRRTADIDVTRAEGVAHGDRLFHLRARPTTTEFVRVAASSQRSVGSAVRRNRARRRLREAFRLEFLERRSLPGMDLVLAARPALLAASPMTLRAAVAREVDRLAGVLA